MKEIQQILKKIDALAPDENAVLATVVDVKGSSYRLPGAKMLILENGEAYGTVSGGCLEADVLERAEKVLASGKAEMFTYDTTGSDDSVFSFNMGCRGIIRILLEPILGNPFIDFLRKCFKEKPGVTVTFLAQGKDFRKRLFFDNKNVENADSINQQIWQNICEVFNSKVSTLQEFESGDVFFEYIAPPTRIEIFGSGADAVPLAEIAKSLGWYVTIVDHRPALANRERFLDVDEIVISRPEEIADKVSLNEESVTVLMTHNFEHDKEILKTLLKSNVRYIGLLGPHVRTERMLSEMRGSGFKISDEELEILHGPVGLDIGAELPETIALSIIAEIQTVIAGREGGFLRNRQGSIYGRG